MKKKKELRSKNNIIKIKYMNQSLASKITPGMYVINEMKKEWGIGQVQSSIHEKITINFEHAGKQVININKVRLNIIELK